MQAKGQPSAEGAKPQSSQSKPRPRSDVTPHLKLCPESKRARGRKLGHVTGPPPRPFLTRQPPPPLPHFLAPPEWDGATTPERRRSQQALDSSITKTHAFPGSGLQAPHPKRAAELPPECHPRDHARLGEAAVRLQYTRPRAPPAQHPPRRVTTRLAAATAPARLRTRLSRCLALSPAHLCPRPFRPSLPLRPVSRRQRRRRWLAQLVGSLYKGEKRADRTAGAAAGGGSGGAGSGDRWWFPPGRGVGSGQRPPDPPKGRGFFFFKGDSRGF